MVSASDHSPTAKMRPVPTALLCLLLTACRTTVPLPGPPDLSRLAIPRQGDTPPEARGSACWAPASLPIPAAPAPAETTAPQAEDDTEVVAPGQRDVWIPAPCPEAITPELVASLQRALQARGAYAQPITGQVDGPTKAAIRRYQAPLGLDSDQLSLAAARALGLLPPEFPGYDPTPPDPVSDSGDQGEPVH